jgi:hypothetical protein
MELSGAKYRFRSRKMTKEEGCCRLNEVYQILDGIAGRRSYYGPIQIPSISSIN